MGGISWLTQLLDYIFHYYTYTQIVVSQLLLLYYDYLTVIITTRMITTTKITMVLIQDVYDGPDTKTTTK
jgi:hypothetical protein